MDVSAVDALTVADVALPFTNGFCYNGIEGNSSSRPEVLRDLIFTVTNTTNQNLEVNPYFGQYNY